MIAQINFRLHPELRALIEKEAAPSESLSDVLARLVAVKVFNRPDLAKVPHKRLGRPRRELVEAR